MGVEGLILMGVSGCGKSTIAAKLSARLGCGA
jgi:adenylate kinase family enzyme